MANKNEIEDIYPLSPVQQGVLFHTLYAPESGVYLEQLSCTLAGELQVPALMAAWQSVIDRQTVLRTGFVWERRDQPLQIVFRRAALPLEQHDWRNMSPAEQEESLASFLHVDRKRGFDLSRPPLMRLALMQKADHLYQFVWSHHLLAMDGWCQSLILNEVFQSYGALCLGYELRLENARPYGNYVEWLGQQDLSRAEKFWRRSLDGFVAPTPLVSSPNRGRVAADDNRRNQQQMRLSARTTARLETFARQRQVTLSILVEGVWALLLSRYSGEPDVVFGIAVSGRPAGLAGSEKMVGLFINTLPLRVQIKGEQQLGEWLEQLQRQQVELQQYEYSPLVEVQGWSEVPRGMPMFESILVFENYPLSGSLPLGDARLEIQDLRTIEQTSYALTIKATPGEELRFTISYDANRFDDGTMRGLISHLQTLLE